MADQEKTRLFFAIVPDDAARDRLDALAAEVARTSGGRPSAPHTLHLTVVFVGTVDGPVAEAVRDAGESTRFRPFDVAIDTLGTFVRAGIAWAAPSLVAPELASANRDLVRALAERGVTTEARPYRPHVTLARRCARAVDGPVEPAIAWRVDRIVLMSSRLLSEGPRYREIASWGM
jgi:2'-5' RNA ligase